MKHAGLAFLLFALAACASQVPIQFHVGHQEAARLLRMHERWLAEAPRKIDVMNVSTTELSEKARGAGFRGGAVSAGIVALWTSDKNGAIEGLAFGRMTVSDLRALESLGFSIESTATGDVRKIKHVAKKEPNQ